MVAAVTAVTAVVLVPLRPRPLTKVLEPPKKQMVLSLRPTGSLTTFHRHPQCVPGEEE